MSDKYSETIKVFQFIGIASAAITAVFATTIILVSAFSPDKSARERINERNAQETQN